MEKRGFFCQCRCRERKLYSSPLSSINFITAHDGFTLRDLVTYQQKYNEENGEGNRDGSNQNESWNCGFEGPTEDLRVKALRERQMRNFLLSLFISQGIPMLLMGDEYEHTRFGNNNPYVQDNEINWFLWDQLDDKMFDFVRSLVSFRKAHPILRKNALLTHLEIEWHNSWDEQCRQVVFTLKRLSPSAYRFQCR